MDTEISLNEYFKEINGAAIACEYGRRCLKIYDAENNLISKVVFSATVPYHFKVEDLFKEVLDVGDMGYYVFNHDPDYQPWLYCIPLELT